MRVLNITSGSTHQFPYSDVEIWRERGFDPIKMVGCYEFLYFCLSCSMILCFPVRYPQLLARFRLETFYTSVCMQFPMSLPAEPTT